MSRSIRPPITVAQETVAHLEALVEGAAAHMQPVADRLLEELSRARIVAAVRVPTDVAGIGSNIIWRDETTGREHSATLVWPEEADITAGRLSVLTPVGVALLGLKAGARFNWETRTGESRELAVLSVSKPAVEGSADPG